MRKETSLPFPTRLKELHSVYSFTQTDLATSLKQSKKTISNYETGTRSPSLNTLVDIANLFNVSIDWLLGRDITNDKRPEDIIKENAERKRLERITKLKQELAELEKLCSFRDSL